MRVESIIGFEQTDENAYELRVCAIEGDFTLRMSAPTAVELYREVARTMSDYVAEMDAARASYKRGEGPNGEAPGTWEADRSPDWGEVALEYADHIRKYQKENPQ
jgi:hypothetical protein